MVPPLGFAEIVITDPARSRFGRRRTKRFLLDAAAHLESSELIYIILLRFVGRCLMPSMLPFFVLFCFRSRSVVGENDFISICVPSLHPPADQPPWFLLLQCTLPIGRLCAIATPR